MNPCLPLPRGGVQYPAHVQRLVRVAPHPGYDEGEGHNRYLTILAHLTHASVLLRELTRHLEMLLEGWQGLASKGSDIRVFALLGYRREELHGFLVIGDHVTH